MRAAGHRLGEGLQPARRRHAHDYPPITFMLRHFDEYRGLRVTAAQLGARPVPTARGAVNAAEQRTDGKAAAKLKPRLEFAPSHASMPTSRPSALAAPDQERAAALIEIGFRQCQRFLDARSGSP